MIQHFIISGSYEDFGQPVPSKAISQYVSQSLKHEGKEPTMILAMSAPYFVSPTKVDLRTVWMNLTDDERNALPTSLKNALLTMMGVPDGTAELRSEGTEERGQTRRAERSVEGLGGQSQTSEGPSSTG